MDRVNKNIRLKNIRRKPTMWVQHTYVGDGTDKTPPNLCVPAIKCIAANSEYMSSPADSTYLPLNLNDIDIEIDFKDLTSTTSSVLIGFGGGFGNPSFSIGFGNGTQELYLTIDSSGVDNVSIDLGLSFPISGNIKAIGNGISIDLLWNDTIVGSLPTTKTNADFTTEILRFNALSGFGSVSFLSDVTFEYIKINNHEWTFPEGTGSPTTNSQGVVTTLNSTVSTEDMWTEVCPPE